jgi:hypothetical protein
MRRMFALIVLSGLMLSCGRGGGGGGTATGPAGAASATLVSGSVQAPNGQIAFNHSPGFIERLANFLAPTAYASLSGLSPVPDGTLVQLARFNATGTGFTVLATTTTVAGTYSFNLTNLGLHVSNDLIVHVANGAVQMRAFVTGSNADLDPMAETSVRLVLEQLAAIPGATLSLFTVQELADITGSINVLVLVKQLGAGTNVENTVTSIRSAVTANAGLMAFIAAAAGDGPTTLGPGDIGNYLPLTQGNIWRYQGTKSVTGQPPLNYQNNVTVTGPKVIGLVTTTVLTESNLDGQGVAQEEYLFKDLQGVNEYGNNDPSDMLSPQLVPFQVLRFPLAPNSSFTPLNKTGLNFEQDLDGDGRNETAVVTSEVSVIGVESVTVPVGLFTNALKVQSASTITVTLSSNGVKVTVTGTATQWLAPGVGPVKDTTVTQGQGSTETVTEELEAYVVDGQGAGIRIQVTPSSLTTQPTLTKPLQATTFDQSNTPVAGVIFLWHSTNTAIAQVAQDGTVTGIAPGTANVTASAFGLTSNAVQITVNDIRILSFATNDIIYDKSRQKIYASIPSTATSNPNSITVIDPVTGNIGPSLAVGTEPTKLAISDDGQFLYVGLNGEGAVRRVLLSSFTVDIKFSLGPAINGCGIFRTVDLKVLPGTPQSVAISRAGTLCFPDFTVVIYDNGLQRSNTTPEDRPPMTSITFPQSPSTLYGYDGASTGSEFVTMAIDSLGVSIANITTGLISEFEVGIVFDAGRIYVSNGVVIDPVSRTLVGTFQAPLLTFQSLVKPDSSVGRVFFFSGGRPGIPFTLLAFNMSTLQSTGSKPVEGITSNRDIASGEITSLIRWGSDGVAFRSSNQVVFAHTSSIQ